MPRATVRAALALGYNWKDGAPSQYGTLLNGTLVSLRATAPSPIMNMGHKTRTSSTYEIESGRLYTSGVGPSPGYANVTAIDSPCSCRFFTTIASRTDFGARQYSHASGPAVTMSGTVEPTGSAAVSPYPSGASIALTVANASSIWPISFLLISNVVYIGPIQHPSSPDDDLRLQTGFGGAARPQSD